MAYLEEIIADLLETKAEEATKPTSSEKSGPDDDVLEIELGIDLGTTNSSAAYISPVTKSPEVIRLEVGMVRDRLPSIVWFDQQNNRIVVGDQARAAAALYPEAVRAEFKRDMPHASAVTYELGDPRLGPTRIETPQSLSTIVLREIRERAERLLTEQFGKPVRTPRAVVTVPANFPEEASSTTMMAAREAGFAEVRLVDEPTAAALAYHLQEQLGSGQRVVIFDFGGGTLDCSMLTKTDNPARLFTVSHPCGDPELGGKDFDEVLVGFLAEQVQSASRRPLDQGPFNVLSDDDIGISPKKRAAWRAALKREAERIKIELSELDATEFALDSDSLVDYDHEPLLVRGEVTRSVFEVRTESLIWRALGVLERTLDEAGVAENEVDRIVLVGGTTLIPAVQRAVHGRMGTRPYMEIDPLTAVARGAAIYGLLMQPGAAPPGDGPGPPEAISGLIRPIASHNLGVRYDFNKLDPLIRKGDELPTRPVMRPYVPHDPSATEVRVLLYQYDDSLIKRAAGGPTILEDRDLDERHAFEIGQVRVDGLSGTNRAIDVTFTMDENRILYVVVRRQDDGQESPLTINRLH